MTKFFEKLYGSKYFVFFVLPIILLAILFTSWSLARQDIESTSDRRFSEENDFIFKTFKERFDSYKQSIFALDAFFRGSDTVTRSEMEDYVQISKTIDLLPGISSISYAELTQRTEVEGLENTVRSEDDYKGISLKEFKINPFVEKDFYYPIVFVSPISERNSILGFDLATESFRVDAIERALASDTIVASEVYNFVSTNRPGFLLIKELEKNGVTQGILVESFRADDFFSAVFERSPFNENLEVMIIGREKASIQSLDIQNLLEDEDLIYYHDNGLTDSKQSVFEIEIADKKWTIITQASQFYDQDRNSTVIPGLILVGMATILGLFYIIILSLRNSKSKIEKSVREQTKLLSEKNKNLSTLKTMLSEAQNLAQIASWEINQKSSKVSYSEEFANIFKLENKKINSLEEFLHLFRESNRKVIQKNIENISEIKEFELDIETKNSTWLKIKAYLDTKEKIVKGTIQNITKEKVAQIDLEDQKDELERLNNIMIDRELKMIELKDTIKKLKK